jgi:hypothetical protein
MRRTLMLALAMLSVGVFSPAARAQIRLIGITGNQETNAANDETLYEINITNAATTRLFQTTHVPDTDSIGYNPVDGLLYHISGSSTYRDTPGQNGYRDNHYMEKINLATQTLTGVFNANPPEVPDMSVALEFGLPAPFPDWVLPDHPRRDDEDDPAIGDLVGPDEYDSAREMAWSATENLFYLATGRGFYTMTPAGDSTFVGQASVEGDNMKGLEFVQVGAQTKLLAGSKETGELFEIDTATGDVIGDPIQVTVNSEPTQRILALATHPSTGVLYGIVEPAGPEVEPIFDRQLVTIDPTTGVANLIGVLANAPDPLNADAAFASLAFVGFSAGNPSDVDDDGDVDGNDFLLIQRGLGGTFDAGDIAAWRANFGQMGVISAVPEPAAMGLVCLAWGAAVAIRRRVR